MAKRAVIYARVSGDDRSKDRRNLNGQLEMGRQHAVDEGWTIVAELAEDDRGASGAEIDLPKLNKVLEMAKVGAFDVLVVREIDRLSRNLAKQLIVEQELERHGVSIHYVIGEYPDTPEGRFQKHVKAAVAELEREKIAERAARGIRHKVRSGSVVMFGRPPYGYRLADVHSDHLIVYHVDGTEERIERDPGDNLTANTRIPWPHEPEARVVRQVFEWYTRGDGNGGPMSIRGIARQLGRDRVPTWGDIWSERNFVEATKQNPYGIWGSSSVSRMLSNETYAGVWYYGPQNIEVQVPAIVSPETWRAAQARRRKNKQNPPVPAKHPYLLRRRVTCGRCQAKMGCRSNHGGRYLYYQCSVYRDVGRARDCDMPNVFRAREVDAAVWDWLCSLLIDPRSLMEALRAEQQEREEFNKPLEERLAVVSDRLTETQVKLERALDLYLAGDYSRDILKSKITELERELTSLKNEQTNLRERLDAALLDDQEVDTLVEFSQRVAQRLRDAEKDFKTRRRIIELLDVQATLCVEDGKHIAHIKCNVGQVDLCIPSRCTSAPAQPRR